MNTVEKALSTVSPEVKEKFNSLVADLDNSIKASCELFGENVGALTITLKPNHDFYKDSITPTYFFHKKPYVTYRPDSQKLSAQGLKR